MGASTIKNNVLVGEKCLSIPPLSLRAAAKECQAPHNCRICRNNDCMPPRYLHERDQHRFNKKKNSQHKKSVNDIRFKGKQKPHLLSSQKNGAEGEGGRGTICPEAFLLLIMLEPELFRGTGSHRLHFNTHSNTALGAPLRSACIKRHTRHTCTCTM